MKHIKIMDIPPFFFKLVNKVKTDNRLTNTQAVVKNKKIV